jgi:hypothetical protein
MQELINFVLKHVVHGACQCGKCIDAPTNPEQHQPTGHTVDMVFFKAKVTGEPTVDDFKRLISENTKGEFCDVNPLDGTEHNYIELGGWIGDQSIALDFMALGSFLGVFVLLTPRMLKLPEDMVMQMAGAGFLAIQSRK